MALRDSTGRRVPHQACKWCGRPVVWVITLNAEQTKKIRLPLDPIAPVYLLEALDVGTGRLEARRELGGAVSHFSTCTKLREARKAMGSKLTSEQHRALAERALREMGEERGLLD